MNFFNKKILHIFFFTNCFFSYSQNPIGIPMGTWRTHYDYSNVKLITHFNNKLFGSSSKGFYYYDFEDNSVNKLSNIDGLSSSGVSSMHSSSTALILGYNNGFLDIIYKDGKIKTMDLFPLLNNNELSKTVNDIFLYDDLIYASTNQGLVVIDVLSLEILEVYFNIGKDGAQINSLQTKIFKDSIFVFFDNGILKSQINDQTNLKDYNSWKEIIITDSLIIGSVILDNNLYTYNKNKVLKYDGKNFNIFKSFTDYKIKKIKNEKFKDWALKFNSDQYDRQFDINMQKFENIMLNLGAEILRSMNDLLVVSPNEAAGELRKKLSKAIITLSQSKDIKKLTIFKKYLERLNAIGGVDGIVPSEGIVFTYNDNLYKLTGTFTPMHRILTLLDF